MYFCFLNRYLQYNYVKFDDEDDDDNDYADDNELFSYPRSSSSAAVAAFAAATAGSVTPDQQPAQGRLQQVSMATGGQQMAQQKQSQSSPRFLTSGTMLKQLF